MIKGVKQQILVSICLCIFSAATVGASPENRPNILLLMAEDMSSRVNVFGDPVASTPVLDKLASQGVRFTNTYTTAGVCAPSRAALIMGMHQISFGGQHMRTMSSPDGRYKAVPPAHDKAFPELLRAAGYFTYTKNKLDYQFSTPFTGSGPFTIWDSEDASASWREREPGQPFFSYLNFGVTHESGVFQPLGNWPNSPMHLLSQLIRGWQYRDAPEVISTDPGKVRVPPFYPDTATVREDMARHYTNISIMDAQVGLVLAELQADGLADDTIVIWTTDHGDGLPRAKRELYDSGIKVPMIVRWPERYRPANLEPGQFDQRLISFVDLAPTILALAGVPAPASMQGRDFASPATPPREYIYASRDRIDEVYDRQRAVRDQRYKYIRSWYPRQEGGHHLDFRDNMSMVRELFQLREEGELNAAQLLWFSAPGEERLFDTQADPFELVNLLDEPDYAHILQRMRQAYRAWAHRVEDWSEIPEVDMMASFQPAGEQQATSKPVITISRGMLAIKSATEGASLGYRIDDGRWQLYTEPFPTAPGSMVVAKAVRYGWQESDEARQLVTE